MPGQTRTARVLSLTLACALAAAAQFSDLAATDNGAHFYFSSPLQLKGTDASSNPKIFRMVEGEGFQQFAERERVPDPFLNRTNFYRLRAPDVSGDGAVVSYAATRDCVGGSACVFVQRNMSVIVGARPALPLEVDGEVRLSRNGRYALQNQVETVFPETNLIDLTTGERTSLVVANRRPGRMGRQPLTRDGAVVLVGLEGAGSISLWTKTGTRQITPSETPAFASINDEGTWIIYESTPAQGGTNLHSIQLPAGTETLLASGSESPYSASITNAGDLVLYIASPSPSQPKQAFAVRPDGTGRRQLTNVPEGINEAVITGNGLIAYAVTAASRILRIDVLPGIVTELVERTPVISAVFGATVPGSLNWIRGSYLAPTTAFAESPLPTSLGGIEVRLGETAMRLQLVSSDEIRYQIPFEIPDGIVSVQVSPNSSIFEQAPLIRTVSRYAPSTVQFGAELPPGPVAGDVLIHADFQSLITYDSPALPNEIVHTYMTGLGQVAPPVPTGEAAPFVPLSRPAQPFVCREFRNGVAVPREVLFAGLAPGMTGIYQISVRMPPDPQPFSTDPNRGSVTLLCGAQDLPDPCFPGSNCAATFLDVPVSVSR